MAMAPDKRQMIEAMIESLIALLDASDGDYDLEDNGDSEPWIDSTPMHGAKGAVYDLEFDDADIEFNGDEHDAFLGWNNPHWPIPETPALTHQEQAA